MATPFKSTALGVRVEDADLLLVLLHGRAVLGNDLVGFARNVLAQISGPRVAVLLPEGPIRDGLGRGWWSMPEEVDIGDASAWIPPERLVDDLVVTVKNATRRCLKQPAIILGGFSAGAVLAAHALPALGSQGVAAQGLIVLSGVLDVQVVAEARKYTPVPMLGSLQIFLAHGHDDPVIPEFVVLDIIEKLHILQSDAPGGDFLYSHFHDGGHEIGDGTLEAISKWLKDMMDTLPKASATVPLEDNSFGQSVVVTDDWLQDFGGDADGQYEENDVVKLRGLVSAEHLNGARGVLKKWNALTGRWVVELVSTGEVKKVKPENIVRHVSEEEHLQKHQDQALTSKQFSELRAAQIDEAFDHPDLLGYVWGKGKVTVPVGSEQAQLGGVPCIVFGRQAAAPAGTPTVLFFKGNSELSSTTFEETANAYVSAFAAQVVVPFCASKLSECLDSARAVAAALPRVLGPGPMLVHGDNTGSILAVQVAAELSHPGMLPRVQLLVLDNGTPSFSYVPRAQSMLGCISADPFAQEAKLRMVRCPVILVRGFKGDLPPRVEREPMDILAGACSKAPISIRSPSMLEEDGGLQANVVEAARQVLAEAGKVVMRWTIEAPSCLVRAGVALKSAEVGRLQSGAIVEQLDQQGTRLRVRKIEGEGPDEGWVSLVVKEKTVLRPLG